MSGTLIFDIIVIFNPTPNRDMMIFLEYTTVETVTILYVVRGLLPDLIEKLKSVGIEVMV